MATRVNARNVRPPQRVHPLMADSDWSDPDLLLVARRQIDAAPAAARPRGAVLADAGYRDAAAFRG